MHRYFIHLAYNGTKYHGWQLQPNAVTVQSVMEKSFSAVLRQEVQITGCGRTDTGVHARFFVAHFDLENPIQNTEEFTKKMNRFLPPDIHIEDIFRVKDEVHSRFTATSRTYQYIILLHKDPFWQEFGAYVFRDLDVKLMNEAAQLLYQYTDFTSFSKLHTQTKNNDCEIMYANWKKSGNKLIFTIQANRFLRNMVRAIVGTMIEVGRKRVSLEKFSEIIEKRDRNVAGVSAPAKGLFLVDITYPNDIILVEKEENIEKS